MTSITTVPLIVVFWIIGITKGRHKSLIYNLVAILSLLDLPWSNYDISEFVNYWDLQVRTSEWLHRPRHQQFMLRGWTIPPEVLQLSCNAKSKSCGEKRYICISRWRFCSTKREQDNGYTLIKSCCRTQCVQVVYIIRQHDAHHKSMTEHKKEPYTQVWALSRYWKHDLTIQNNLSTSGNEARFKLHYCCKPVLPRHWMSNKATGSMKWALCHSFLTTVRRP